MNKLSNSLIAGCSLLLWGYHILGFAHTMKAGVVAAEMATIARIWGVDLSKAEASEHQKRLVSELSEPVTQRILRTSGVCHLTGLEALRDKLSCIGFWPTEAHTSTNILCAIMQARSCSLSIL